ncbi:hypothetical protein NDU88_002070 [Pleurodeles waltl]|uniref:Uncharacterized protein n=1 Tax=Pleurodeles waltl TaxID=8319 RepID=A0AAV7TK57_PLEWA|nr:hypothetical protein NDU88_002070 [Pleurodeles waltl]
MLSFEYRISIIIFRATGDLGSLLPKVFIMRAAEVGDPAATEIESRDFIEAAQMKSPATGVRSLLPGSQMALDGRIRTLVPGWHWRQTCSVASAPGNHLLNNLHYCMEKKGR